MQLSSLNFSINRFVRFVLGAYICTLMFLYTSVPALANTNTKGEEQMPKIQIKSQKVVESDPYSLEKTQYESNKGLNEVQGDADKDKMYNPNNTDGPASVEQQIGNALESAKDKTDNVIGSAKNKATNTASSLKNKAANTMDSAKGKAENTSSNLKDKAKNTFDAAKGKAENTSTNLKDKAKNTADSVKAKADQDSESLTDKVKNLFQ